MIMTIMLMVVELTMMMVIIYDHSNIFLKSSLKIQVQWATKVVETLLENDAFGY